MGMDMDGAEASAHGGVPTPGSLGVAEANAATMVAAAATSPAPAGTSVAPSA